MAGTIEELDVDKERAHSRQRGNFHVTVGRAATPTIASNLCKNISVICTTFSRVIPSRFMETLPVSEWGMEALF